jgi:membrane dipeptidase
MNLHPVDASASEYSSSRSIAEKELGTLEKALLVDGHVDLPYYLMNHGKDVSLGDLDHGPFTLEKAKEAGIRLFCTALYCEDQFNGEAALKHLQDILQFTLDHIEPVKLVKEAEGIKTQWEDTDRMGTFLLLENADALAQNLSYLETLRKAGVRIVGLTHRGRNRLADGDAVRHAEGLSREGRGVVSALHENGLLIDVAHLHPVCFWELMRRMEGPVITSHTGVRTKCDIPRNIDLDQAREILGRNGVIGISFNPEMLSPKGKATLEDVFVHVDILVQKFGPNCVGIGSDFGGFDTPTVGLEDISKVPQLKDMMLEHGYGQEAAEKIMGLNWLRIYQGLT